MREAASRTPNTKAHRTVGCQVSQTGAAPRVAVNDGENFAIICWLFGSAQTMNNRRATLAGAGILSSMGTARTWWVLVRNVEMGPRCCRTDITVLGTGIASKPCIPNIPASIPIASLTEDARNTTMAATAATKVSRTLEPVTPAATHLFSLSLFNFGPNIRQA